MTLYAASVLITMLMMVLPTLTSTLLPNQPRKYWGGAVLGW